MPGLRFEIWGTDEKTAKYNSKWFLRVWVFFAIVLEDNRFMVHLGLKDYFQKLPAEI